MSAVSASVLEAAIAWRLCLGSGEANAEQRRDFDRWLAAHPEHRRVWQQLQGLDAQLDAASAAPVRQALLQRPRRRSLKRLGGCALSLLSGAALLLGLLTQQRPLSDYLADELTARGEQRDLWLTDRSRVRLNSASALDIDFSGDERLLHLRSGDLRISGSFPLHDNDLALAALPPSLPVRIQRLSDWWVRVLPAEK